MRIELILGEGSKVFGVVDPMFQHEVFYADYPRRRILTYHLLHLTLERSKCRILDLSFFYNYEKYV